MANFLDAKCPRCGSYDRVQVEVRVWVEADQDGFAFVEESLDAVFNPGPEDGAACTGCGWRGTFSELH